MVRSGATLVDTIMGVAVIVIAATVSMTAWSTDDVQPGQDPHMLRKKQFDQAVTQIRGIHQAMVVFAQNNNNWFPGLNSRGGGNPRVEDIYQTLIDGNHIKQEFMINPADAPNRKPVGPETDRVTADNYSYAMLEINPSPELAQVKEGERIPGRLIGDRRREWRDTINTEAVVLCDRRIGDKGQPRSVWSDQPDLWKGLVGWNDNHVSAEVSQVVKDTRFGRVQVVNAEDDLFETVGESDALMINSGNNLPTANQNQSE